MYNGIFLKNFNKNLQFVTKGQFYKYYILFVYKEKDMSEPLKVFWKTARANDVDDKLLSMPVVETTLESLENYGKNLGEAAEKLFKKPPVPPSGPTPTYQESAFIKPENENTLYNVTNSESKLPVVTSISKVFKNLSYSVRGFSAAATLKENNTGYSLIAGEKIGAGIYHKESNTIKKLNATYNVGNKKASLNYSYSDPINSYGITIFNKGSNYGATASYSNTNGLEAALSVDRNSASAECKYNKSLHECNVELGAYATTGDNYANMFAGVRGRISF